MNTYRKRLKASLASRVRNIDSLAALKYVEISDFLFFDFLNKSTTVSSALPPIPTTLLFLALNAFEVDNLDDLVVFNIKISGAIILLKP